MKFKIFERREKMNKKALTPLAIAMIVIGVLVVGYFAVTMMQGSNAFDNGFIKVRLYDKDGNPINFPQTQSVVGLTAGAGVRGVGYIDITPKVTNSGGIPIFCDIISATVNGASGTPFDTALTRSTKSIPVGSSAEWTSNLFSVSSFEGTPDPDVFSVTVRCQYTDATGNHVISPDQSGSLNLYITSDGTGSFTVQINSPGGLPNMYCGDRTCNNGETVSTCPVDCVTQTNSLFRTSDLSYPQGSAIARTSTCGNVLTGFGYESSSCWAVTGSTCPTYTGYTRILSSSTIPGRPFWANSGTPTCLYTKDSDATRMAVAFQVATTGGSPCSTVGQWGAVNYYTLSSYTPQVSTSYTTQNNLKEVVC